MTTWRALDQHPQGILVLEQWLGSFPVRFCRGPPWAPSSGERSAEYPSGWSVFSGDVNDFKDLNSKLGYDGADLVLHSVGSVLADLLAIDCPAFRRGGDEFVVLAPTSRVEDVVALIRSKLSPLATRVEQTTIEVFTSFGYTSIDTGLSFRENLDRADRACKAAKWQGNGAVIQWSAEIKVGFSARLRCPSCRTQVSLAVAPERSQNLTLSCMVCGLTLPSSHEQP